MGGGVMDTTIQTHEDLVIGEAVYETETITVDLTGTAGSIVDTTTYPVASQAAKTEIVTVDGGDAQTVTFTSDIDQGYAIDTTTYPVSNQGTRTQGTVTDTTTYPVASQTGLTEKVTVDSGSEQTVTFSENYDQARIADTTTYECSNQNGKTEKVTIDGGSEQTVTFSGETITAASVASQMDAQLYGCKVVVESGQVVIYSDTKGASSSISIGTGTCDLTWAAAADVNSAEDIAFQLNAGLTGASAYVESSQVVIESDSLGDGSTVDIGTGTCGLSWDIPVDGASNTLSIALDGGSAQTIEFSGTVTTAAHVAAQIDAQLSGGKAVVEGTQVAVYSNTKGSTSAVAITDSDCGLTFDTPTVVNSAADIAAQLNDQLDGCSVDTSGGQVVIESDSTGQDSSVAIGTGTCTLTWDTATAGTGDPATWGKGTVLARNSSTSKLEAYKSTGSNDLDNPRFVLPYDVTFSTSGDHRHRVLKSGKVLASRLSAISDPTTELTALEKDALMMNSGIIPIASR
jgi:hypothetical protein